MFIPLLRPISESRLLFGIIHEIWLKYASFTKIDLFAVRNRLSTGTTSSALADVLTVDAVFRLEHLIYLGNMHVK
jgi:hypothetical protein